MPPLDMFLRLIWPSVGNKTIATIKDTIVQHYWFQPDQITEAATKANELSNAGLNVYMGVGGFTANTRKAEQIAALKTLFLDIDCGYDADGKVKDYPDQEQARTALGTFLQATTLPKPLTVSSGHGLHIYWPLEQDVNYEEWKVLASSLKTLCDKHGLRTDKKCTADAARILRPIGTYNYKNGVPVRVRVLDAGQIIVVKNIRDTLLKQTPNIFEELAKHQPSTARPSTASFNDQPPVQLDDILPRCATLRHIKDNQNEISEPLWYGALGLSIYCTNPTDTAKILSSHHVSYDESHTLQKQQQWQHSVSGPPTCDYFRGCSGSKCEGCPETVTTPLVLGRPRGARPAPEVEIPTGPTEQPVKRFTDKFLRIDGYGLQVAMQGKPDGNGNTPPPSWIKIANFGLQPRMCLKLVDRNGERIDHVWMEAHDDMDVVRYNFVVPATSINKNEMFAHECAKHGIVNEQEVSPTAFKIFVAIMRNWVRKLQERQTHVQTFEAFGWMGESDTHAKDMFLLGDKLITKDKTDTVPLLSHLKEYQQEMTSRGTLEEWTKAMDHYNLPGMEGHMFASWAAWGAPLMAFTASKNVVLSLVGETGVGKSSVQRAIASVYGNYNSNILVDQSDSTINSVNANLGCLNSLPYIREEAAEAKPDEIASWVLTMTQGRDRGRLNSAMNKLPVKTWSTIAVVSSNISIREIVINERHDNAARLARTWEMYLKSPLSQTEAQKLFRPLQNNYGHAGPLYMGYVVPNLDQVITMIKEVEDALTAQFKAVGVDRFHISLLTACFVGASIAISLGLIHHDFERGKKFAVAQYRKLHQSAIDEEMTPEQILAKFIQDIRPQTLVVEADAPTARKLDFVADTKDNIIAQPSSNQTIAARYAADTSSFYVDATLIRKWFVENHLNYRLMMNHLLGKGVLVEENKKIVLTKGTRLADKRQIRSSWFNLSKSDELIEVMG